MTACNPGPSRTPLIGRKVLEVIVTSVAEAIEAEQGGADRLEIVRSLEQGGLTPSADLVEQIMAAVQVPVRVMLRDADSMQVADEAELARLLLAAQRLAALPVEGLVLGFVRDGKVDEVALRQVFSAVPGVATTFHRAFEHLKNPLSGLATLKTFPQIDRVLIRVREDGGGIGLADARTWQQMAEPQIRFIVGIGLERTLLLSLRDEPSLSEIHVGRGAREPETPVGLVSRRKVAELKSSLL